MARYGLTPEQRLTIQTRQEDRRKAGPPIPHVCADGGGRLTYDRYDRVWFVGDSDEESAPRGTRFCPYCGIDLAALVPKE